MKVGWINFLNTLPFDFEKVGIKPDIDIQIIKDYPAVLNKLLKEGKIDIGIISSAEYIENYKGYLILPDLSISSCKDVKSVSILSNTPLEDIKELYLTKASKSSVLLTKIIFKEFLKKDIIYHSLENWENLEKKSVLFIGDAAILFKDKFKYVYDLSYLWYKYTKMPFTFALWCVRKDFYKDHLKEVLLFHKLLIQTKERFFNDIDKYLDNINFDKDFAKEYLLNLDYNLEKKHIESLKKFSEYLLKNGFIKELTEFRFTDKLIITNDGTTTIYNSNYEEAYHSIKAGAYTESLYKFIIPCNIENLAKEGSIKILDVGFGLGYNVATAITFAKQINKDVKIEFISIEKDENILEKIKILDIPENLKYAYSLINSLKEGEILLNNKIFKTLEIDKDNIKITVIIGEGREIIKELAEKGEKFDAVFYDPFSPKVNTEMWSVDLFKLIRKIMKGTAIFATYSASLAVRKGLLEAGFKISVVPPVGRKSSSTIATISGDIPPMPEKEEKRLKNSPFAISYKDESFSLSSKEIQERYEEEVKSFSTF